MTALGLPKTFSRKGVTLHPGQSEMFRGLWLDKDFRYAVCCATRGWGKSVFAGACAAGAIEELVKMPKGTPNRNVALIASTFQQAQDVFYPMLAYNFGLLDYATRTSKRDGLFYFGEEVCLKIWSAEAVDRMRGTGQYFVVTDELSAWKIPGNTPKQLWEGVIKPCMDTRWPEDSRALIISTPRGFDYFHDLYSNELIDEDWKSFHFDYTQAPYLSTKAVEKARALLDPLTFAREYLASFEESGASVFPDFDRKTHVDAMLEDFREGETVHACIDFNINIMATSIFALRGKSVQILDEFKGARNTDELVEILKVRYLDKGHRVIAYPDPTGRRGQTQGTIGKSDFNILEAAGIITQARAKNPPIVDSVAAVNAKIKSARGNMELAVHPRCMHTIRSLERTVWEERSTEIAKIDKTQNIEHFSDGIRYAMEYLFPVRAGGSSAFATPHRLL